MLTRKTKQDLGGWPEDYAWGDTLQRKVWNWLRIM